MSQNTGQHVFITGTNSGFGQLMARDLAERGHRVFATMRDIDGRNAERAAELEAHGQGAIDVLEMSLVDDRSVARAAAAVLERAGHIDAIINNAGYAIMGLEETVGSDQLLALLDVNAVGPHRVMRAFLPSMRARGRGLIVQISSSLGRVSMPVMGAYSASKWALEALSEAYRYELLPTGVELTIVQPGAYATDLGSRIVMGVDETRAQGYGPVADAMDIANQGFAQLFARPDVPEPRQVALAVRALIEAPLGSRPARVVVDPMGGEMIEAHNQRHHEVQARALSFFGLDRFADERADADDFADDFDDEITGDFGVALSDEVKR